jgi:hypothetical protein
VRIERIEASSERRDRLEHRHEHLRLERVRNSASSVIQARENGRRAARRAHLDRAKRRTELLCARYGARAAAAVAAMCGGGFERMSSAEAASASRSAASVLSWAPSASNRSATFQQAEQQCLRGARRFGHRRCGATAPEAAPLSARVLPPSPESTAFCSLSIRARAQRQLLLLQDAQVGRVRRSLRCRLTSKFKGEPPRTSTAALGTLRLPPPALLLATEGGRRDGGGLMDLGDSEGLDARPVGAFLMPTDGLLLLGLVVGGARTSPCASVALPGGRRCLGQPLRPWPLVGLHLVKGAATEVVATAEVRASVTVAAETRAAVRAEAKVPATEVVRAVAEARAAASRGNASMDVGRRRRSLDPDRDTYRDHVNSGL